MASVDVIIAAAAIINYKIDKTNLLTRAFNYAFCLCKRNLTHVPCTLIDELYGYMYGRCCLRYIHVLSGRLCACMEKQIFHVY